MVEGTKNRDGEGEGSGTRFIETNRREKTNRGGRKEETTGEEEG